MFAIAGYRVLGQIAEGNKSVIYRGLCESTGETVIIKAMKTEYPPLQDVYRWKREFEIAKSLDWEGIVRPIALEPRDNGVVMIVEDFGGESLYHHLQKKRIDLLEFLQIAISLADTLSFLHRQQIVHKDIKPHNIIVSPEKGIVKLTDFSIASMLVSEKTEMINPNLLEGTLAYMSPEQTGRMNRVTDYRTDFYSLGVTFYEMLVGQAPFQAQDPVELIHCHIAKQPQPPHVRNREIPKVISDLIMRCLAKNAEARYQSAYGIKADLEACLFFLQEEGTIGDFPLGEHDQSEIFRIPEKLYGREQDISQMHATFQRVVQGASELLLVSGFPGIGKTFFVHEVHSTVVQKNGFFITGKFDQYKRHIPYHAFIRSMKDLINQLLTQSEEDILNWGEKISLAVAPNGQVITDVIPELELIIGKQPDVQKLPNEETQNRFQLTMQKLLHVFCQPEHPVVLFLDDLQWADPASLTLIEYLMSDMVTGHLLFIGAYRDNEVDQSHRLTRMVGSLRQKRRPILPIRLQPLNLYQMKELLADTLSCSADRVASLAQLLLQKTNGNPFFTHQFLQALHAKQLIQWEAAAGRWNWKVANIANMEITDNVVEFMVQKIRGLNENTQLMLQTAACIGNSFDLQMLALSVGQSISEVADELWPALQEGFLVPIGTDYKLLYNIGEESDRDEVNASFKFLHDRVQQAAYALLSEENRTRVHLEIGRLMLSRTGNLEFEDRLFDMVNHLNAGAELIESAEETMQLIRLNLTAGLRAKASTAYDPALKYLTQAVELLAEDAWEAQYDLTMQLYLERSEVEYLCGNFRLAEKLFDLILAKAKTKLEKVRVYNIKTVLLINIGEYEEAIKLGLMSIRLLGIKLSDDAGLGTFVWETLKAKWNLRNRKLEELLELPLVEDPYHEEAMLQIFNIAVAFYFINPQQFSLLNLKVLNMTAKRGNSIASSIAFGGYGVILGTVLGDIETGYQYGRLATQVNDKYFANVKHKSDFSFALLAKHWKDHLRECADLFRMTHQTSIDSGDLIQSFFAVMQMVNCMILCGEPLQEIERDARNYLEFAKRVKVRDHGINYLILKALVQCLLGKTASLTDLSDDDFQEEEYLEQLKWDKRLHFLNWYYFVKTKLHYLNEQPDLAVQMAREGEAIILASMSQPHVPEHYFYYSLALAANYHAVSKEEQKAYWKQLKKNRDKLKKWAKFAAQNNEHKRLLVEAEMARLVGNEYRAMQLYDRAIESAHEHSFPNNAALANECAAKFYLKLAKHKVAKTYMAEAVYGYLRWGAVAKVRQLEQTYPYLLATRLESEASLELAATGTGISTTGASSGEKIDLLTVMKAARAISGEIVLDKLLATMIHIAVENAGAEKGVLLIEQEGDLLIEAEKTTVDDQVCVLQAIPYRNSLSVAPTVIQYVRRMREAVVLHDAASAGIFAKDPYILQKKPKSVLCLPILNQGKLVGALYLENNLTTHAFTEARLEMMSLLSSQIAVSIDNAKLYNQQVELNRAYGRFVPHQFLRFLEKKSIIDVRLGDHVQTEMSVLFSDIRSFTTLSERMSPEENFQFLNEFLSRMEPAITDNRGFVDKYIGDSIMSLFDQGADDAVQAALSMLGRLRLLNEERSKNGQEQIRLGIGINSGKLMLGTLGGDNRMDSTVISDAVNLASRVEGLTKRYRVQLLISEQTLSRLQDSGRYSIRIIDRVKVKGKSVAVSVYEVFDADLPEVRAGKLRTKELFEQGYRHYQEQDFVSAKACFEACLQENPLDECAQVYVDRCLHCLQYGYDEYWTNEGAKT